MTGKEKHLIKRGEDFSDHATAATFGLALLPDKTTNK